MRDCGRYSRVSNETNQEAENNFDLDAEINNFVEKQKALIEEAEDVTLNDEQLKCILKAVLSEIIERI